MVSRTCLDCGQIIPASHRRCAEHERAYNRLRGSSHQRGYTRRWRRISERQRRRVPWCELRLPGCTGLAQAADHIVPLEDGGKSTADNARSACTSCNNRRGYTKNPDVA